MSWTNMCERCRTEYDDSLEGEQCPKCDGFNEITRVPKTGEMKAHRLPDLDNFNDTGRDIKKMARYEAYESLNKKHKKILDDTYA